MNRNLGKFASIIITTMLLLSIIAIFPASALPATRIYVDPPLVEGTALGQEFTIDIVLADVANLFGWEVKLFWDNSLLNATKEVYPILPPGLNWGDPNNIKLGPGIKNDYNATHGRWYRGLSAVPMAEPFPIAFSGTIKLVTLTFKVIKAATTVDLSCPLHLSESKLADPDAKPILHTTEDGSYIFYYVAAPGPWLEVYPAKITASIVGETKSIDIKINEVLLEHRLVGLEFKLRFNATLLGVVGATEGPFMKDPAWALNGTHFIGPIVEEDEIGWFVHIGILILPHIDGNWTAFPEGSGVLATITFNATYLEAEPGVTYSCDLLLDGIKLSNDAGEKIVPRLALTKHGKYEFYLVVGRVIDLFTQYPEPYGGQGPKKASEAFAPQAEVILYAKVTYNDEAVANKLVSFQARDPTAKIVLDRTAFTNLTGIATVSFRIPWPAEDAEAAVFGTWECAANVEIAEVMVEDHVWFEVGWIVEITDVTAEKTAYKKGDVLKFTLTYKSLMMELSVYATFTIVVYDELGVPICKMLLEDFPVEPGPEKPKDINGVQIIPMWAYVGKATAYANAFTVEPMVAYCPEKSFEFSIMKT